jgi:hypothetical protein
MFESFLRNVLHMEQPRSRKNDLKVA